MSSPHTPPTPLASLAPRRPLSPRSSIMSQGWTPQPESVSIDPPDAVLHATLPALAAGSPVHRPFLSPVPNISSPSHHHFSFHVATTPTTQVPVDAFDAQPSASFSNTSFQQPPSLTSPPNPFSTSLARDAIMAYAYDLYQSSSAQPPGLTPIPVFSPHTPAPSSESTFRLRLLPILLALRSSYPNHIPILLLLACTYHALGDYSSSLALSHQILTLDSNFVEAMSNVGATYRAIGRDDRAYEWWWKALRARPMYWDAMDNLLGLLFAHAQATQDNSRRVAFYRQALSICQFSQHQIVRDDGRLLLVIPSSELYRLQRVFITTATIQNLIDADGGRRSIVDYFRSVELVIRPPSPYMDSQCYTMRDLLLAACVAGYTISASSNGPVPREILESLGMQRNVSFGGRIAEPPVDLLFAVHASGDHLVDTLLRLGGGALPVLLLLPEQVMHSSMIIFQSSAGVLPSICMRPTHASALQPPPETVRQQTHLLASTVLLTMARMFQDGAFTSITVPGFGDALHISPSLTLMLYYLALSLSPTASTYNNLGILLSTMSSTRTLRNYHERLTLNGPNLARLYYQAGLQLEPDHPHLLTNLASLLKDEGQTEKAIELYLKAIHQKPDFDIALANLGNSVKDLGRSWDAIEYYRRAVSINPDLPEAVCGLVNSLCSVCDWRGRGGFAEDICVDDVGNMIPSREPGGTVNQGWILKTVETSAWQLETSYTFGVGIIEGTAQLEEWLSFVACAKGRPLREDEHRRWCASFHRFYNQREWAQHNVNEAGFLIRFIDWLQPRLQRQWYLRAFGKVLSSAMPADDVTPDLSASFTRPALPANLDMPPVPSVLPFHTFTYPLSARTSRLIAHRNALRISYMALVQTWLPRHVYRPPLPPVGGKLNIGYVSNDVNNHPLAHLMQSVFGLHDRARFRVFLYTTSQWDGSMYRPKISGDVEKFMDVSSWTPDAIVEHIKQSEIHILINLGGYTKGARNDIFAARPCPVQMQLMGYAGTLGAGWCDYLVCDEIACPQDMCITERWRQTRHEVQASPLEHGPNSRIVFDLDADADPESMSDEWLYMEKLMYMPHTVMATDHKQSFRQDEGLSPEARSKIPASTLWLNEEARRARLRLSLFPDLSRDAIIFANFSQLYKIDPTIFAAWLRILGQVKNSILWLLRFPAAGEEHILRTAKMWAGEGVAARIRFTNVASKEEHIHRSRVADLFLDTTECNAHTIAADVLWTGTPVLTLPRHRHKMCSRVAAGMARATGFGDRMVVHTLEQYENRAVALAQSVRRVYDGGDAGAARMHGDLINLRMNLFLNRDTMPLFDTVRWTRNLEKGFREAWRRWVEGTQFELSDEWETCDGPEKESGCIRVVDDDPIELITYD